MADLQAQLDDAAAAALWMLALEHDPRREHLGLLYVDDDGAVKRTPAVDGAKSRVRGAFTIPAGSLRGTYHNHPPRDRSGNHSDKDKGEARRLGVPSYISAGHKVIRFDPRSNTTAEVLAQFPIEEYLQFIAQKRARENPLAAAIIAEQNQKRTRAGSQR